MDKDKNRIFDTKVQHLKYRVLRETARLAWGGELNEKLMDVPDIIVPGPEPSMRCCIYKERAIVKERVKIAMGGDRSNPNVIEVLPIACDECPMGGYEVSGACRGCLAHRCEDACRQNAITIGDNYIAHIDKSKCIECGQCAKACPYSAIINQRRPCEMACKVKAISMDENKAAKIDNSKCISCGACVYMCPWGAIMDDSYITDVIDIIKKSEGGEKYKVYAVIAPSIASQFSYATLGQVVSGIKALGFDDVIEAALGADMVAYTEARELSEKEFLTSSCCPAFVDYIHKNFPELAEHISHNLSPAATIAQYIKKASPESKIIFIGPCTAKKMEVQKKEVHQYIEAALTFEELQALFDSRDLVLHEMEESALDNASYFGRIFARSGGLSDAVEEALKEQDIKDFELKAVRCSGIEECKKALTMAKFKKSDKNFIEGMACVDGCIGGAGCLTHGNKNRADVDAYGKEAYEKSIKDAISLIKIL